jgi:chromosome segregation protein
VTFIRRLEIKGFKSSGPRPVAINFEKGFTVITGPNGSGKSNIADAIMFAIGENSPKQLRAGTGKLTGLIFDPRKEDTAGTERPSSCRVSIQFDNSDRKILVDSDVVTVARELKDDGENVYYLNGRKTTRGSVTEILDLAGLTAGGLNIVPQGAATRVADLTPEEKRRVIEDTVGIAKFDERKAEAQRQLSQADQRLEVAMARIGEMKSTLEQLDTQRNDLIRVNLLQNQINYLTAVQTSKRIRELKEKLSSMRAQEQEVAARIADLTARMNDYEARALAVESEKTRFIVDVIQGGGSGPVQLQVQLGALRSELDDLESDFKVAQENIAQLEGEAIPQLKQVVSAKQKEVTASNANVRQLTAEVAKLDGRRLEQSARLKDFFNAGETLRSTIDKNAKRSARITVRLADLGQKLNAAELSINAASASLGAEKKRLDELKVRVDGYSEVLGKLDSSTKKLFELYDGSTRELNAIDSDLGGVDKTREALLSSIEAANRTLAKATAEVSREEAFKRISESLSRDRTGQANLQEFCESGGVPGYVGRLGQLVKYPPAYAKAVNAIMGRWTGAFVVQDLTAMTRLIKAAKSLKAKSFSVIPLSEVRRTKEVDVERSAGVIGTLSSVIKCDGEFQGAVNFLAGDTVLVDTEAIGYILSSEGVRAVTVSGETFEPGSKAFTFGYQEALMNLMEGLENLEGTEEIEDAVGALKKAIDRRKSQLDSLDTESKSLTRDRVRKIVSTTSLRAEAATIARMSSRYKAVFRNLNAEYQRQEKVVERLQARVTASTEQRDSLATGAAALRLALADIQALGLESMMAELDATKQSLSSEIDSLRSRISDASLVLSREKANLENVLERALEDNEIDLSNAQEDLRSNKEFARDAPRRIRELTEQKTGLEQQIQKILDSSKRSQPVLDEYDAKIRRLREERDSVSRSIAGSQRDQATLAGQISTTQDRMDEAMGSVRMLGYTQELEVFETSDSLLAQVEAEYEEAVSLVNRGADRQYTEMYTNYKSLSVRNNELEKERVAIIGFIEDVEGEKMKVFMAAFEKVRAEFSGIFRRLTGGEAWLELESPDEVFAGGVSLMATFNERVSESLELSGGQRAVTGVSFILAMQAVQSHPFYMFDEIDAALDAVNSSSLARFFKERAAEAQIIAITLRDVFVAESSITYGVYSAGGISRVVHYKPAEVPVGPG